MNLYENFKMALESIKANKLRSFLTMLGIIIGISSVIMIVSLGQGGKNSITDEFEKIGATTVTVTVNSSKAEQGDYITLKDIEKIKNNIDAVKYVTPAPQKNGQMKSERKSKTAYITGGNVDLYYINNDEILYGRYFNEKEAQEGKPVAVIDEVTARTMFGYTDAVGKSIQIGEKSSTKKVTIVGITKNTMGMFGGGDSDNMPAFATIPVKFMEELYSNNLIIDKVYVMAVSKEESEDAGNLTRNLLEGIHNNRGKDMYTVESVMKQIDQVNKVLSIFTTFISAVAAISLLVGGIGVMNIMLVSVTERTREIGIRKAIGATTRTILVQFLTESVIISLIGGIIGMTLGILGAQLIGLFVKITPSVSVGVVVTAILFSSAVGIFFGIYPARKAAKLDPIEALRYE